MAWNNCLITTLCGFRPRGQLGLFSGYPVHWPQHLNRKYLYTQKNSGVLNALPATKPKMFGLARVSTVATVMRSGMCMRDLPKIMWRISSGIWDYIAAPFAMKLLVSWWTTQWSVALGSKSQPGKTWRNLARNNLKFWCELAVLVSFCFL